MIVPTFLSQSVALKKTKKKTDKNQEHCFSLENINKQGLMTHALKTRNSISCVSVGDILRNRFFNVSFFLRKLLKKVPPDLQEKLWGLTSRIEEQLNGAQRPCGL